MSNQKYPNSGALFKNERMRPDKNDPPYNGSAEVNGVQYWVSAWLKEGQKGKFFSMSFKPKEAKMDAPAQTAPDQAGPEESVPF